YEQHVSMLFFFLFSKLRPPPRPTLFPYTTLFRSTTHTASRSPRQWGTDPTIGGCTRHTPGTTRCRARPRTDLEAGRIGRDRRPRTADTSPPPQRGRRHCPPRPHSRGWSPKAPRSYHGRRLFRGFRRL